MTETKPWPVAPGAYKVGDPGGPVAVCALTSERLVDSLANLPGVAITGTVQTANLGIIRIVQNITSNQAIRFLLLCGKDSALFRPGQSMVALAENGVDSDNRIVGAEGYDPVIGGLSENEISNFRKQVEVLDWTGEEDLSKLTDIISGLEVRNPGPFEGPEHQSDVRTVEKLERILPGGRREPLIYDPKGYFVISLDQQNREILLMHYLPNHTPAHEMRGHSATSMLLGLLREGLITQLSHAGYLGEELAKAEAALALGIRYDQDRPLHKVEVTSAYQPPPDQRKDLQNTRPPGMPSVKLPMTLQQMESIMVGSKVDVVLEVTEVAGLKLLETTFLESDAAEPFNIFHRKERKISFEWDEATRFIMGSASDVHLNSLVRVVGPLSANGAIKAEQIVILTKVAKVL